MKEIEKILYDVVIYINDNITDKLTIESLAKHAYLSPAHLQYTFKEYYGIPIAEYIRKLKLKKALEMLVKSDARVSDIAYDIGFEHESSFIRSFKREFGMTPGKARKKQLVVYNRLFFAFCGYENF